MAVLPTVLSRGASGLPEPTGAIRHPPSTVRERCQRGVTPASSRGARATAGVPGVTKGLKMVPERLVGRIAASGGSRTGSPSTRAVDGGREPTCFRPGTGATDLGGPHTRLSTRCAG
ncbi:hypothetical protein GCM10010294_30460 [Streptomyces griseoloalbus]|nr:hypothetical protein GCM10010294_30460 [Streptomyces griseoloalbus]